MANRAQIRRETPMPRLSVRSRPGSPFWQYDYVAPGFRKRGTTGLSVAEYTWENVDRGPRLE